MPIEKKKKQNRQKRKQNLSNNIDMVFIPLDINSNTLKQRVEPSEINSKKGGFKPVLANSSYLDIEMPNLIQLRDLLTRKHYREPFIFIPTAYENMPDPRKELITICSCMQNNENAYIKKLYEKYAKISYLMFIKFAQQLPCMLRAAETSKPGRIIGVNKNKEFAIETEDGKYIGRVMLPKRRLFGGHPTLSDSVKVAENDGSNGVHQAAFSTSVISANTASTVKSKNMIHSTGAGYSAGSSDNYFSESTSDAEEGLCE